ncbi:hypothetical protein B0I37DRAFT_97544 [Chaetomium sp. MPI-CAGE-AT-0009]|nr:hypothetical protein B0I37DRAFT_97544 [Chaetomium sp. MPI-CAGE-AT-0009]
MLANVSGAISHCTSLPGLLALLSSFFSLMLEGSASVCCFFCFILGRLFDISLGQRSVGLPLAVTAVTIGVSNVIGLISKWSAVVLVLVLARVGCSVSLAEYGGWLACLGPAGRWRWMDV